MARDVRPAVVAGSFYAGSASQLAADVDELLAGARRSARSQVGGVVRGVVTPHAGYIYSGPIAATAYAFLSTAARATAPIVVLGPSHFVPVRGLALSGHRAWSTPLGEVTIDVAARDALVAAGAAVDELPHRSEHSIEVQMPFITRCFPGVSVLPVAVGTGAPEANAAKLAETITADTLLVVSTDLSHYHDVATARALDARTAAAVEALDHGGIAPEDACGADALRAGLAWADSCGYRVHLLDLRNSADTAGDADRVVGYGAFAITSDEPQY